ncbi:Spo0E family sporulation regulatory protein-aspartic acid phosphatase [Paraliobacillus quinghaiensis]|uniref:Spo0E family sporulation regulatory protein-aspartic acid phosphatase n=2 Tax=Paraliobacillus quinghaiensis TaxID=470815 RepID=UPI0030845649
MKKRKYGFMSYTKKVVRTIVIQECINDRTTSIERSNLNLKREEIEKLRLQMYSRYNSTKNKQELLAVSQELDKLIYEFITISGK